MACEYCKDGEYIIADHGIDLGIQELINGHWYIYATVTIDLAGESKVFYTNVHVTYCPMCGEKLGGDA